MAAVRLLASTPAAEQPVVVSSAVMPALVGLMA